ncbi:putative cytochrome P450 [Streptomyces sp. L-9-10]|uniref:cytochrome P450 n=1 Tax=Streptomyces sp. L-9-10 TaxID=1478131 RepID=UPI0010E8E977|nr:cytochrome P450 [Streptomyces sp. L-9-10]RYJ31692.1 putative cytochrome P450 [Streptomyces sp. L-9-10]
MNHPSPLSPSAECPAHSPGAELLPLSAATGASEPREVYRRLREQWGNVARVELEPGVPAWLVMGYRELLTITRQEQVFSRDARNWRDLNEGVVPPHSGLLPMMAWRANVIGADGPEHRRLRQPLDDGVARIDQRKARRQVQSVCTELIARFSQQGRADLVNDYATIVPLLSIASLFGLNSAEGQELLRALIALFGSADDSQDGNRHFEEILVDALRRRQESPTDDLTTAFINHPNLRTESERIQSMAVMISSGTEGVNAWTSLTLRLMLTDPRFAARMHGGRLGVDDALDEALWRDPPMNNMPARYALRDTELGGRRIRRGDVLILGIAAANDDPAIRPDDTAGEPGNRAHLAFSAGPHVCPAQVPARLITRTAVNTVLHLLPDMRLAIPAEAVAWHPSPWTRIPVSLPVEFSAARIPVIGSR